MCTRDGRRRSSRRPVGWPMMSTAGARSRAGDAPVICSASCATRVHRGDDDVERGEAVVGEVELPSARMSHSMPASSVKPAKRPFSARTRAACAQRARLVEAVGHRQRLAVVGDGDVLEPRAAAAAGHLLERVAAVGLGRVHVQVAAEVAARQQPRQRAAPRPLDLAAVLAQLRRHPRQAERLVDRLLGLAGDPRSSVARRTARTRSACQPRSIARSRSTMLCAFEPVKYCRAAPRLSGGTRRRSAW